MADEAPSIQQRILDAARELFLTKGYNGSNLRDIARVAQVSMGGIYHHFGSKEEIYQGLLNQATVVEALQPIVKLFRDPRFPENLGEIGAEIFRIARANQDYWKLMYIDVLEFQGKNVSPIMSAFRNTFTEQSGELLKHRAGEITDDVHPAIITRSVFDLFMYFVLEEVMIPGTSLSKTLGMSDEELAEAMARVLLRGIMRSPPGS